MILSLERISLNELRGRKLCCICGGSSDGGGLCLLGSLHDMLHSFKSFFPLSDLLLDSLPLSKLDLAEHMALDDNLFTKLINLRVNDLVLNRIDRPQFNLIHIDLLYDDKSKMMLQKTERNKKRGDTYIEELSQLCVREVSHLCVQCANLHIRLFDHEFLLCETFILHQVSVLIQLCFELLCCRLCEHVEKRENFSMLLCELLDGWEVLQLREIDNVDSLDGQNDASASVILCLRNRAI